MIEDGEGEGEGQGGPEPGPGPGHGDDNMVLASPNHDVARASPLALVQGNPLWQMSGASGGGGGARLELASPMAALNLVTSSVTSLPKSPFARMGSMEGAALDLPMVTPTHTHMHTHKHPHAKNHARTQVNTPAHAHRSWSW